MNNPHKNARMTPLGRAEMVRRIVEDGRPTAEVAAGFGISERTARKWVARWRAEGNAGLENRSSCPRSAVSNASVFWKATAERLRRDYRLTGSEIAAKMNLARSTVAGWLTRMGLGRPAAIEPKEPVRRYQRERPGELLHLDIKKLARFDGVGHRITGDRRGCSQGMGYDFLTNRAIGAGFIFLAEGRVEKSFVQAAEIPRRVLTEQEPLRQAGKAEKTTRRKPEAAQDFSAAATSG